MIVRNISNKKSLLIGYDIFFKRLKIRHDETWIATLHLVRSESHWVPLGPRLTTGIGQLVLHELLYEFLYILITLFVIVLYACSIQIEGGEFPVI